MILPLLHEAGHRQPQESAKVDRAASYKTLRTEVILKQIESRSLTGPGDTKLFAYVDSVYCRKAHILRLQAAPRRHCFKSVDPGVGIVLSHFLDPFNL